MNHRSIYCLVIVTFLLTTRFSSPAAGLPFSALAKTPPMGWNSYDAFGSSVTEAEFLANANYIKEKLLPSGYNTVVVDFRWADTTAANYDPNGIGGPLVADQFGRLLPSPVRFPSAADGRGFKPLADKVHALGLKFGIHVMRGIPKQSVQANTPIEGSQFKAVDAANTNSTCKWCKDMWGIDATKQAGQDYYDSIFRLYASWGVDFVKVDDLSQPYHNEEIEAVRRAIDRCGRPMVFSTSPGQTPVEHASHISTHANLWRVSGDFWDKWASLDRAFDLAAKWQGVAGPGHWPDGDMLPLGRIGIRCVGGDRMTRFTKDEQVTLMSLWALMPSPLMLGGHQPDNDAWTLSLITNPEMLAINQDPLGKPGRRVIKKDRTEVWVRDLKDGGCAVGIFNRGETNANVTLNLKEAGLVANGTSRLKNVWTGEIMDTPGAEIAIPVPRHGAALLTGFSSSLVAHAADTSSSDGKKGSLTVKDQHSEIGIPSVKNPAAVHTSHPDAQWYPEAGLGLFLHWSISSVKAMNISWPMIPGKNLRSIRITDPAERERIVREKDFELKGKPWETTPNQYWALAKDFNPGKYDPDKWCQAAKDAGFTYVVLTTRHHDGFAMWPSAFGEFSTKNYMGGRDLVKPFVEACRRHGLKVGLYYSPPDWHFERDFKNFFSYAAQTNPEFPALDADLKPRLNSKSAEEVARHHVAYDALVRGQVEELLTRYGKIDLLWFDGCQPTPNGPKSITADEIRKLQPGIVINPRLHGTGDFITYERDLKTDKVATTWAEFCNTWALLWTYDTRPFRANGFVLGQLAVSRSLGINYLLGIGPDGQGELHPAAYQNMEVLAGWMKRNGDAVHAVKPLPPGETANVPATAKGTARFLFAIPEFKKVNGAPGMFDKDMLPLSDLTLTLKGVSTKPESVLLLGDGSELSFEYSAQTLTIKLPAAQRTKLVDVVQVVLKP